MIVGMVHGLGHLVHFPCLNATHNNCFFSIIPNVKSNLLYTVVRDDECILWLLATPCCEKKCTRKLSVDVNATELHFRNIDQTQRRNYVLAYLSDHSQVDYSGDYMTEFMVKGKSVCREVWLLIHSINKKWFRRLFNKFKEGAVEVEHGSKGTKKPSQRTTDCIAWLQFFVSCVGQYQPDNKTIHLPSCFTRLSIYRQLCEENIKSFNTPSIGLSQFYSIFHDHFPHVVIPKVSMLVW